MNPSEPREELRICRDCVTKFLITFEESAFFLDRGLALPKRCRACRSARRAVNGLRHGEHAPTRPYDSEREENR